MNNDNFEYLNRQLQYLGFSDTLKDQLENNLKARSDSFNLSATLSYSSSEKKEASYELHFRKGNEDMYFLNSYKATVGEQSGLFYVNKGEKNITSKEAFNLLEGRSVYRELTNKEGEKYYGWQKIDLENSEGEKIKFKTFTDNYGYDLEAAVKQVASKQLFFGLDKEKTMQSLQKGNQVPVSNMDKSEKFFVAADPQFKSIEIYNENGIKLRLDDLNKEQAQTEKQSAGMKM